MLKVAAKQNHLNQLKMHASSNSNGSIYNTQRRLVQTHYQWEDLSTTREKMRGFLDTNLSISFNVGILKMNREHRYNTLTSHYIKSLSRGIESLNRDDNVKLIYMSPQNGEHFSNGTDFRTIMHHKKERDYQKIAEYLNEIYALQIQVAKTNKPIISVAPGHSFNSGAALLQATGLPVVTLDTLMSFNDVTFGFVPHGGSSFYLSRLPNEIGTFLGLTGLPLMGADAMEFKLADSLVHESTECEKDVAEYFHSIHQPIPNARLLSNNFQEKKWQQYLDTRNKHMKDDMLDNYTEMLRKQKQDTSISQEFEEPRDKLPSLHAKADYQFKNKMEEFNRSRGETEPGYLESGNPIYQNYYNYVMSYMRLHMGHPYSKSGDTFMKHQDVINRCFYPSRVEEIMELLRKEESKFAKLCLQRMEANSMLSMKITLKMLRDARNKDYKGAFETELNVGLNKIQDADFDLGVAKILMAPSKMSQGNPGFRTDIGQEEVLSYFAESKHAKGLDLGVVEKAMLPTRFYYQKFSDQVRLWVNETSTTQKDVRLLFNMEVKEALREQGIDIRDRALTVKSARAALYEKEQHERVQQAYSERISQFSLDSTLRENYFHQIKQEIDDLEKNDDELFRLVNEKIQKIFEDAYLEKLDLVFNKSKEAHGLEKRRMFIRFKQFLFKSRVLTYANEEMDKLIKQVSNMPTKEIHLTEKWDQSYRDMEHPDIQKSPLWYLSKAIGKVNLAPAELAQQYLTNPNIKKQSTLYTFDKEELIKLRRDILQNPEKYETVLLAGSKNNEILDRQWMNDKKDEEYEFWYRTLYQGRCPLDNIKFYKELQVYKTFVNGIEKKALNTLKLTISRLLQDFEHQDNINIVEEFSQDKGEKKTQALKRLMSLVNQESVSKETKFQRKQKKAKENAQGTLVSTKRSLKEIKQAMQLLANDDKELRQLFQSQEQAEANPLVRKLRETMLDELYKLIEIVLLNNKEGNISKDTLQERYAALTNPGGSEGATASLMFIDSYLAEATNKDIVKQAIHIVKPYFFQMMNSKLEEEMESVIQGFDGTQSAYGFLEYYYINTTHPEIRNSPIVQRIQQFTVKKEKQKYLDIAFPEQSSHFKMKQYLIQMGQQGGKEQLEARKLSIEQQEELLTLQAQEVYKGLEQVRQEKDKNATAHKKELEQRRQFRLSQPFNPDLPDKELEITPEFDGRIFSYDELNAIFTNCINADRVSLHLESILSELKESMSHADWMGVFSKCVNEFDMDVEMTMKFHGNPQQQRGNNILENMQNVFNANRNLGWNDLATYAQYIKGICDAAAETVARPESVRNFDYMAKFMSGQMQIQDISLEDEARQASMFDMITNEKYSVHFQNRSDGLRNEINDLVSVQAKIEAKREVKNAIMTEVEKAPKEVKEFVAGVLRSESKYVNYKQLLAMVQEKQYTNITKGDFFKEDKLVRDFFSDRNELKDRILNDYGNIKLDVVSLAELEQIVTNEQFKETYSDFYQNAFKSVIDDIDHQLRNLSNQRRKDITLGAFLSRHHHLNSEAISQFTGDILRKQLQNVLGEGKDGVNVDKSIIDWEYGLNADVRTDPQHHRIEDQKEEQVKALYWKDGGYKAERDIQEEIDTYLEDIMEGTEERQMEKPTRIRNYITGQIDMVDESHVDYIQVLKDAKEVTQIPIDFEPIRAQFENAILRSYCQIDGEKFEEEHVNKLIGQYTEARLKECSMNGEFNEKVKDKNNGHIYMKVLKETIMKELNLDTPAQPVELAAENIQDKEKEAVRWLEFESKYNMNRVNDGNQMGYDNMEQRLSIAKEKINEYDVLSVDKDRETQAERAKEARDLAHETVFDKLLAEYYLAKRDQYAKSKELINQLDKQFKRKEDYLSAEGIIKDPKTMNIADNLLGLEDMSHNKSNITLALLQQRINKNDIARVNPTDFVAIMELDIATAQALSDGKCGLDARLRESKDLLELTIPEYFMTNDVRKPPHVWVDQKLEQILTQIFQMRRQVEKTMNRRELVAYDRVLTQVLNKETIISRIRNEMEKDKNGLHQVGQMVEMEQENKGNAVRQGEKTENTQPAVNESISDEDSIYKFMSFSGMLEKKRREEFAKDKEKQTEAAYGVHSFEEFYKTELVNEAKREKKREYKLDPEDYEPKKHLQKKMEREGAEEDKEKLGFRSTKQREADFFKDFEKFKENKKEQQQRTQLFYVLEQFYAQTQENPDPLSKAQTVINEYFNNTQNTYFFDKNKIQ